MLKIKPFWYDTILKIIVWLYKTLIYDTKIIFMRTKVSPNSKPWEYNRWNCFVEAALSDEQRRHAYKDRSRIGLQCLGSKWLQGTHTPHVGARASLLPFMLKAMTNPTKIIFYSITARLNRVLIRKTRSPRICWTILHYLIKLQN